jgi:hypothetical protein
MKKITMTVIILVAFLASVGYVSAGAVSANLVANGGFETPVKIGNWQLFPESNDGSGWNVETGTGDAATTVSGGLEIRNQSTASFSPFEGSQYVQLGSRNPGTQADTTMISQVIPQVTGTTYRVAFVQSCRPDDPAPSNLAIYWGDTQLDHTSCPSNHAATWVSRSYTITATSNDSVILKFANEGTADSYGTMLDDVSVRAVNETMPVPEFPLGVIPAFLFGFIGFIHIIRKEW